MTTPPKPRQPATKHVHVNSQFAHPGESLEFPRFRLRDTGTTAETAYQLVHDEAMLDGNARLNLATFLGTWMDDEANRLYAEAASKNLIDKDEYPLTAAIEHRCWRMLASLWNAPDAETSLGTSTVGSSEACMLAGLALKRRWKRQREAAKKPTDKPNLVMSSAVQVCWEKFCNYWDIEPRFVPISQEHRVLDGHDLDKYVDENTIGVVAILGVTYTGMYEPVHTISHALDVIQEKTGLDIPIHVDAASGGMIAPFLQPELVWDFRLPRVSSINTSAHKYGLVYPGLGWVIWREASLLPDDLIFSVSYLGGSMPTFGLNFSRPGAQVLLQYYMFLRLGFDGYKATQNQARSTAMVLSQEIGKLAPFRLWNDGSDIPVFAWELVPGYTKNWNLYNLSSRLRMHGWLVPAYRMPDSLEKIVVQRIVVRNGFTQDLARDFLDDLKAEVAFLDSLTSPMPPEKNEIFHH